MDKKAQGLSLNTIIVAIIVLIVLVVLILIFSGRMGTFGDGIDSTSSSLCRGNLNHVSSKCYDGSCPANRVQMDGGPFVDCDTTEDKVCCYLDSNE